MASPTHPRPLHQSVQAAMESYFEHLGDTPVSNLYTMVLAEVEVPMIKAVLKRTQFNLCQTAATLGLNRGTLRRKMRQHQLDLWMDKQRR